MVTVANGRQSLMNLLDGMTVNLWKLPTRVITLLIPMTLALSSCGPSPGTPKQHARGDVPYTVDWGSCLVSVIPKVGEPIGDVKYIIEFPDTLKKLQFVNVYESPKDLYLAFKAFPYMHTECWPVSSGSFSPGHDSPEDAATGYLQAVESGHNNQACTYVAMSLARCIDGITSGGHVSVVNGNAAAAGSITSGDRALVEITGHLCFSDGRCVGNTDLLAGMPIGAETFAQAWANVLSNGSFSPGLYKKVNGLWYFTPLG